MSLDDVLSLKGFWAKSLVDLLTALEHVIRHPRGRKARPTDSIGEFEGPRRGERWPRQGQRMAPDTLRKYSV